MEAKPGEPAFHRLYPSIVRSVRQSGLLDAWMDSRGCSGLPTLDEFVALHAYPDAGELMIYDVVHGETGPKYKVRSEGATLVASFGFSGKGKFLDEVLAPNLWNYAAPIYHTCVNRRLPVYTIFSVLDRQARRVLYERLLLPFGETLSVTQIVASLKTTAWEGEFENKDLMRSEGHEPQYVLRALISKAW